VTGFPITNHQPSTTY